ncbi:MAG: FkbM family methyltransferase [Bacteroidales bacterium]|nr:FkbM family methyltransferase [Bacteroidales bacterium]
MKFIKRVLFLIFSERIYFRIVSSFFFILYFSGLLKISGRFRMHYLVSRLIKEGDTIIDIGANLGYYTRIFARATGSKGLVWAVEPVPLYREVLRLNTRRLSNILILPYALGDKQAVKHMGIPGEQPYRHGLTRIMAKDEQGVKPGLEVEVKTPSDLFSNLERIDYIKCDIEGYEDRVIPGFMEIIRRDRPLIQIEIEPSNRKQINDILSREGYKPYLPHKKGLAEISISEKYNDDLLYIHRNSYDQIKKFINNRNI